MGIGLIVEVMIDNKNWMVLDVWMIFLKNGGNFGEIGSVLFMFDCVGCVIYLFEIVEVDDVLEVVIDGGVEDCFLSEDSYEIFCVDMDLSDVVVVFIDCFGDLMSVKLIWRLKNMIEVIGDSVFIFMKFLEFFDDNDDV